MSYEIHLDVFEGPLDLLLHLIHRTEVSITDIPIAVITARYLETIELMKSLNLDVAGEYLVMAAYLTHIKSRMLLPYDNEAEPDTRGPDPRDELVAHLLEYKRYKEIAEELGARPLLDQQVFTRERIDDLEREPPEARVSAIRIEDLVAALKVVLERTPRRDLIELEPDRLSVKDKINEILSLLRNNGRITFESLFAEEGSRLTIVTTFLALLELVKLGLAGIHQDTPYATILISERTDTDDGIKGPYQQTLRMGGYDPAKDSIRQATKIGSVIPSSNLEGDNG
ncbi:MAG: segregation/condensation protein A [Pseudomonadota bacterium]